MARLGTNAAIAVLVLHSPRAEPGGPTNDRRRHGLERDTADQEYIMFHSVFLTIQRRKSHLALPDMTFSRSAGDKPSFLSAAIDSEMGPNGASVANTT